MQTLAWITTGFAVAVAVIALMLWWTAKAQDWMFEDDPYDDCP